MKKLLFVTSVIFAMVLASAVTGYTDSFTYYLNYEFSEGVAPKATPLWLPLTFDNQGTAGSVKMSLTGNLISDEFIQQGLYLNFDPNLNANILTSIRISSYGGITSIFTGIDAYEADGDGLFHIKMEFDNAPPSARLGAGDSSVYDITYTGIAASSFNHVSINVPVRKTGFHPAAHIGGIGEQGGSGWIGNEVTSVPEQSTLLLFGTGLIGLAGIARRKRA